MPWRLRGKFSASANQLYRATRKMPPLKMSQRGPRPPGFSYLQYFHLARLPTGSQEAILLFGRLIEERCFVPPTAKPRPFSDADYIGLEAWMP